MLNKTRTRPTKQLMDLNATKSAGVKLLLYGDPGSGKTRLAYSAQLDERMSPVLGINAFGNPESIREYKSWPDIINISEISDLNDPYDWLLAGQPDTHPFAQQFGLDGINYKTIVIDTLTDVQRYAFDESLHAQQKPGVLQPKREWVHFNQVLGQMIMLSKLFYSLADNGLHVIMTAHEKKKEDRLTGFDRYQPLLDGQSDQEVPGKALMIARMMHVSRLSGSQKRDIASANAPASAQEAAAESTIAAFVKPTSSYVAKDQYGTGQDFFLDPTMSTILDAIEQAGQKKP